MKQLIASILSSAFVFAASFEPVNNYLAQRWASDQASVVRDINRVKAVKVWKNGVETVEFYGVPKNVRAINQYSVCVLTPERCKTGR